jgi:pantoate--beta-alanine ligase
METIQNIKVLKQKIKALKQKQLKIGFVPTMGYLHEGHLSLVRKAKETCDIVVVSIFVNPTQFDPNEDLEKYPQDLARDTKLLEQENTDILFIPTAAEIYPAGRENITFIEVPELGAKLCGDSRPNHFNGVTTVVTKLFNIVEPDQAFFGQKDYQQLVIIKKMTSDLNIPTEIVPCPIIREDDGLAMSSRNSYLSTEEKKAAVVLSISLTATKHYLQDKNDISAGEVKTIINDLLKKEPLAKVDYVEIVETGTLTPVEKIETGNLIALAVFIGKTRLIDNWLVGE